MGLDIDVDFHAELKAMKNEVGKVRASIDRMARFHFFQRRLIAQATPTAAGTITVDMGSPSSGSLWTLSSVYNGPNSTTPWVGANQTNWLGGALCIGDASAFTPADVICIFGTSSSSPGAANPEFFTFPSESIWVMPGESLYVAQQFANATAPFVITNVVAREYQLDDVFPRFI